MMLIVIAWLGSAAVLLVALVVLAQMGEDLDPEDWKPCAGHDPHDPSAKQCWVRKDSGRDLCPRHDGSGATVLMT